MIAAIDSPPKIKFCPEDFLVFESVAVRMTDTGDGAYQYLRMRKRGFTTFEAIATVAEFGGLARQDVTYAGLKDEDAITDQYICVPADASSYPVETFNAVHRGEDTFIQLTGIGTAATPMRVGRLDGNSFRIVIRNLSPEAATALAGRRHNHVFLNYYDTQRFGVPHGPKTTHQVGANLVSGDAARALELVKQSQTSEAKNAQGWTDPPELFFASLDPRVLSFYYSAYASHLWNWQLGDLLDVTGETLTEHRAGIPYQFLVSREAVAELGTRWPDLEYTKYRPSDTGELEVTTSTRATVVQAQVAAGSAEVDEFHSGSYRCEIALFLPSGCYATMAVTQLLHRLPIQ